MVKFRSFSLTHFDPPLFLSLAPPAHQSTHMPAMVAASFDFEAGDTVAVLVGGASKRSSGSDAGGGGGTFVVRKWPGVAPLGSAQAATGLAGSETKEAQAARLLLVAGGGGGTRGSSSDNDGCNGNHLSENGSSGVGSSKAAGGTSGSGGREAGSYVCGGTPRGPVFISANPWFFSSSFFTSSKQTILWRGVFRRLYFFLVSTSPPYPGMATAAAGCLRTGSAAVAHRAESPSSPNPRLLQRAL